MNTIIIAIIVMIVLVVIIMVFTGFFGSSVMPGLKKCENNGGKCIFEAEDGEGCGYDVYGSSLAKIDANCPGTQICCAKGLGTGTAHEDLSNCGEVGNVPCSKIIGSGCRAGLTVEDGICTPPDIEAIPAARDP